MINIRAGGILMHLSSLPSPYGIGTMGQAARDFVDFLKDAGQKYWQILPVCPTGYGDSPYQSFSTFAGNPYFIDLDMLREEGLLLGEEYENTDWGEDETKVDYGKLYENRYDVLKLAFDRFRKKENSDYVAFCKEQRDWLCDYALFMTLKNVHQGASWLFWEEKYKRRDRQALEKIEKEKEYEIEFYKFTQYCFFRQWNELKSYANDNGIEIIGDLPIYVAQDSADVWAGTEMFLLDSDLKPTAVAGCPPDGFSATGQLWGNPLFNWNEMRKDDYAWWVRRIGFATSIYNVLRLDHFRGFESFYAIPYGDEDASGGHWEKGPGIELFESVKRQIGERKVVAEDLGFLTEPVKKLLEDSGFPGMKVLELGFDSRDENSSEYLPHNMKKHCVAYTGTHDNDTIQGWFETASKEDVLYAMDYLGITDTENIHWKMMKALWATVADLAIVQAQDLFGLGSESRMNTPSTFGSNWTWRTKKENLTKDISERLAKEMKLYKR